jgi:epoxyqueuosine reductase
MGNRIYGCDDCQLVCPWNKFAQAASHPDLRRARLGLDAAKLTDLFSWSETDFEERLRGSAIRRIGHERWLRNIAIALGNGARSEETLAALESRRHHPSPVVREHVEWALQQLATRSG